MPVNPTPQAAPSDANTLLGLDFNPSSGSYMPPKEVLLPVGNLNFAVVYYALELTHDRTSRSLHTQTQKCFFLRRKVFSDRNANASTSSFVCFDFGEK